MALPSPLTASQAAIAQRVVDAMRLRKDACIYKRLRGNQELSSLTDASAPYAEIAVQVKALYEGGDVGAITRAIQAAQR